MSREGALAVMIAVAVAVLALLLWGWLRRVRRDAWMTAPVGEIPTAAMTTAVFACLYVATTRHDEPLERLAIRGLGFRSRADLTVTDAGIALDLTGAPRLFLPRAGLVTADQSTVAIDRVVEKDGLARIAWRIDATTVVDSFLRPQDASSRAVVEAIAPLLPSSPSTQTGSDA